MIQPVTSLPTSLPREEVTVIAVPKGRILKELLPLFEHSGLQPEDDFFDEDSRKLSFATNREDVVLIRTRSFDVPSFVSFGGADIGISGSDVLAEFNYDNLFSPLDLGIGKCRLSLAAPVALADDANFWNDSHVRVATKYVNSTRRFFAGRGVQAECIKLNGAIELAPTLGLCRRIVDLVSSGATLKANGLKEMEVIMEASSRVILSRVAWKTRMEALRPLLEGFEAASRK